MSKYVQVIHKIDSCHECPYHSGGESLGSEMYCKYSSIPLRIFDSNGQDCQFVEGKPIAWFCQLKDNILDDKTYVVS